jgi:outer membrane protein OmpA-like peptidoglycan-associated protein
MTKLSLVVLLLGLVSAAAFAQDDETVSAKSIVDALAGGNETRALTVVRKRTVEGLSIDLKIEFEFDSSQLTREASGQLDQLLKAVEDPALSQFGFEIIGHTDGKGDEDYNLALSQRRAQSVIEYLVAGGVEAARLSPIGKGETELLYPHRPGDAANRRVEIINQGEIN